MFHTVLGEMMPVKYLCLILVITTLMIHIPIEVYYGKRKKRKTETDDDYGAADGVSELENRGGMAPIARPIRIQVDGHTDNRGAGQRKKKSKNNNRGRRRQ